VRKRSANKASDPVKSAAGFGLTWCWSLSRVLLFLRFRTDKLPQGVTFLDFGHPLIEIKHTH